MRELFDEVNRDWEEHECRLLYTKINYSYNHFYAYLIIRVQP